MYYLKFKKYMPTNLVQKVVEFIIRNLKKIQGFVSNGNIIVDRGAFCLKSSLVIKNYFFQCTLNFRTPCKMTGFLQDIYELLHLFKASFCSLIVFESRKNKCLLVHSEEIVKTLVIAREKEGKFNCVDSKRCSELMSLRTTECVLLRFNPICCLPLITGNNRLNALTRESISRSV